MSEGHLTGGLLLFLGLLLAGCGGAGADVEPRLPAPVAGPLTTYARLGLLVGGEAFPAVAGFSQLAGPADSTLVLFGLSLPNAALRFQRDAGGFVGEYLVSIDVARDDSLVRRLDRREFVRVPTFAETARVDESVVFQTPLVLAPGRYVVKVRVRDGFSAAGFSALDTLDVQRFDGVRALAGPVVVYAAAGRPARDSVPDLVVNPRRTAAYGAEEPRVYVERYDTAGDPLVLRVVDLQGNEVHADTVRMEAQPADDEAAGTLRHAVVVLPQRVLPLGRSWIELGRPMSAEAARREPLVVTVSDQWLVANFDEVLQFLSYIASRAELDSLRTAEPALRRERWERFWMRRDPVPATPINEYREAFFERVRTVTLRFAEPALPGWRTDRGEVYIVLGEPTQVYHRRLGDFESVGRLEAEQWIYDRSPVGRLELLFVDRTGFGRYELTPSSAMAFRSAARRLRPEG